LLANDRWNANRYSVRLANLAALGHFDRLAVALFTASGVANGLRAALRNHRANCVVAGLGAAFRNHFAGRVVANLGAWFANIAANCVVAGLGAAFRNHSASGVVADLGSWFANIAAYCVVAGLRAAFWNHLANGVVASLGAALRNHTANGVANFLRAALRNFTANGVWNFSSTAFGYVACALYFFGLASWDPDLLADRFWWALSALGAAATRNINVLASRFVKYPSTWFTNGSLHHWTGNFLGHSLPATTLDGDRLGVRNWNRNGVVFGTNLLLGYGVVNRVVYRTSFGFMNRIHDRVVDRLRTCLVNRHIDGVVDRASLGLVHRLFDRVVDRLLMGLVYGLHDRIVDRASLGLVHGLFDRVVDRLLVCFVHGLHYRVVRRARFGFVNGLHDRVRYFAGLSFRNHAGSCNYLVNVVNFVASTIASFLSLFVNCLADSSHRRIRAAGNSSAINHGAVCDDSTFDNASASTTATTFIADRTAISGVDLPSRSTDQSGRENGQHPQASHFPYSKCNNANCAGRSFWPARLGKTLTPPVLHPYSFALFESASVIRQRRAESIDCANWVNEINETWCSNYIDY
jgi:hypothetical protein